MIYQQVAPADPLTRSHTARKRAARAAFFRNLFWAAVLQVPPSECPTHQQIILRGANVGCAIQPQSSAPTFVQYCFISLYAYCICISALFMHTKLLFSHSLPVLFYNT